MQFFYAMDLKWAPTQPKTKARRGTAAVLLFRFFAALILLAIGCGPPLHHAKHTNHCKLACLYCVAEEPCEAPERDSGGATDRECFLFVACHTQSEFTQRDIAAVSNNIPSETATPPTNGFLQAIEYPPEVA